MNKAQFIDALAEKANLSKADSKRALNAYMEIVKECMCKKEEVVLIGFGTLAPWPQTSRLARNPKTGTPVMIQPRLSVKFKPGKYLLDAINKK